MDKHPVSELMFFGDLHGDFAPVIAAVDRFRPEAIVLLGDIQARQPLHVELRAIDELATMFDARLLVHGRHHENIDYVGQGLMDASAPFRAFGVDKGSHLTWPFEERTPE